MEMRESGLVLVSAKTKTFQRALEWFAAVCEAAAIKVSFSKSNVMVLDRKSMECPTPG